MVALKENADFLPRRWLWSRPSHSSKNVTGLWGETSKGFIPNVSKIIGIYPIDIHHIRCIWGWLLRVPSQGYHHFPHGKKLSNYQIHKTSEVLLQTPWILFDGTKQKAPDLKRNIITQISMFGFHVKFPAVYIYIYIHILANYCFFSLRSAFMNLIQLASWLTTGWYLKPNNCRSQIVNYLIRVWSATK